MGDAIIVSKDGDLMNYRFQKDEEEERPVMVVVQEPTNSLRDYIIFIIVIGIFVIISFCFYLLKNGKRNR